MFFGSYRPANRPAIKDIIPDITIGLISLPIAIVLQEIAPLVLPQLRDGRTDALRLFVTILFIFILSSFIAYIGYDHFDRRFPDSHDFDDSRTWQKSMLTWLALMVLFAGVMLSTIFDIGSCLGEPTCESLIFGESNGMAERVLIANLGIFCWAWMSLRNRELLMIEYPVLYPYFFLMFACNLMFNAAPFFLSS